MRAVYYGSIKNATASGCTPRIAGPTTSIPIPKRGMWKSISSPVPGFPTRYGSPRLLSRPCSGHNVRVWTFASPIRCFLAHDGAETGHVTGMLEDPAGRLWVMTERKLFVFKPDGHPLAAVTNLPGNVNALCEDQQGRLWISDATGRLSCMHTYPTGIRPTTRYKLPLSPHDRIRHLCCDSTGHIWMATELGCLYSFYPKASKWSNHTLSGLPDMSPVLHLEAIGKDLWLVTPSAVIRYNPEKRTRHTYNTQDKHVPVFAFRNNASCTGHKKLLYAGGHGGFITIRTDKPQPEVKPDKIFLTDLRIEDRNMQTDPCEGFSWNGGLIVLPPEASASNSVFPPYIFFFRKHPHSIPACRPGPEPHTTQSRCTHGFLRPPA